jgi:hypothetical protein
LTTLTDHRHSPGVANNAAIVNVEGFALHLPDRENQSRVITAELKSVQKCLALPSESSRGCASPKRCSPTSALHELKETQPTSPSREGAFACLQTEKPKTQTVGRSRGGLFCYKP